MAYIYDSDLEFLKECENDDLRTLVDYLTTDKDGDVRWTESLTSTEEYKEFYPHNLQKLYPIFAEELQHFGGDSIMNLFRGNGVLYREILCDVAKKAKVNFNKDSSTERIEELYLQKIMSDAIDKMSEEELKTFIEEFNGGKSFTGVTGAALTQLAHQLVKNSGFHLYKMSVIIANQISKALLGRGLALATNAALTRTISLAFGPIMWIITGLWLVKDITAPAYRVTTPCVIHIIYLRLKMKNNSNNSNNSNI